MLLTIANETTAQEKRVALTPDALPKLARLGLSVTIQSGAGTAAGYPNAAYEAAGAKVLSDKDFAKAKGALHLRITPPAPKATLPLEKDGLLICLNPPAGTPHLALQKLPRTSRAQAMDVLSSQANLAGYAAVLLAAGRLPRLMPMLSTAAGSSKPAQALILGVGVAGLQAIATARRLGAQVAAFDVRPEVADQIKSLGAKPIDLGLTAESKGGYAGKLTAEQEAAQQAALIPHLAKADLIITTAQVPSAAAPILLSKEAAAQLKPASVVVDMAAVTNAAQGLKGGNCPLTKAGEETLTESGALLLGPTHLTSMVAGDASRFFATNMVNLLNILIKDGKVSYEDELIAAMKGE